MNHKPMLDWPWGHDLTNFVTYGNILTQHGGMGVYCGNFARGCNPTWIAWIKLWLASANVSMLLRGDSERDSERETLSHP